MSHCARYPSGKEDDKKMIEKIKAGAKTFIIEASLEFARIIEVSVIPVLLLGINITTGEIVINWILVKALLLVAVIKAVDKGLHKSGIAEQGLTRY